MSYVSLYVLFMAQLKDELVLKFSQNATLNWDIQHRIQITSDKMK